MPHLNPRDWNPDHEERLRAALHSEAEKVETDPGALEEIRRRTAKTPFWRAPVVAGLAGATALAGAMIVGTVLVVNGSDDDPVAGAGESPTAITPSDEATGAAPGPSDAPPAEPSGEPTDTEGTPTEGASPDEDTADAPEDSGGARFEGAMPVYYAAPDPSGELRLTREFHHVDTTDDPVQVAVSKVFAEQPEDPDYVSLWAASDVSSVDVTDEAIVVDLPAVPAVEPPDADEPAIEAAVQQLVYTATAAAASVDGADGGKPVRVLVNGERPDELHAVGLHMDLSRSSQVDIRQLVQINDPSQDGEVTSPVAVRGEAAAHEAALEWEVRDGSDEVVDSGTANTGVCCEFSEFTFSLELDPGTYTLTVASTDPSGGEGPGPVTDSKNFQVIDPEPGDPEDDPTSSPSPESTPDSSPEAPTPTGTPPTD